MASIKELREEFARGQAPTELASQVGSGFVKRDHARGWTTRAVWYERDGELLGVVGRQEKSETDIVLAHGLHLADGRRLSLVLPEEWSAPTRHRAPWLTAAIEVFTYDLENGMQARTRLTKAETRQQAGEAERSRALHLGGNAEWIRALVEWATQHPELDAAHSKSMRAWSCDGQRVLTVRGKRGFKITAGVDATHDPAASFALAAPLPAAELASIKDSVEAGIDHAKKKTHGRFEEHHLQVILRRDPHLLLLEHPLLREVPAWRPSGGAKPLGRGFIDLAGLDPAGDIAVVETKLDSDDMLVLQGLDYWIWATADENHDWLADRLYANSKASTNLLYAVAGKGGRKPTIGKYERTHLALLDPEIQWRVALIEGWNDSKAATLVDMLEPRTLP